MAGRATGGLSVDSEFDRVAVINSSRLILCCSLISALLLLLPNV